MVVGHYQQINEIFMDKLTYYDLLANLLPGVIFLWAVSVLGPIGDGDILLLLTSNTIIDSILFISLSYVVGHLIQFLSKYTVEPFIKWTFWNGHFFSDIFLIGALKKCSEVELKKYISFAEIKLGFSLADLVVLLDADVMSDETKKKKSLELSRAIYRFVDAKTQDASLAFKAHSQNAFYSMFRNLSAVFLFLGILDLFAILFKFVAPSLTLNVIIVVNILVCFAFLIRAKQRGELYIKGLFWSYTW
jgi:hypothetical protein